MAGYQLITKSGHNMFEMLSLLQKSIRRGDVEGAGYASNECFEKYHTVLWNRIVCISCEDCWGVVTKEIVALRYLDEIAEAKKNGNTFFVSQAINLLCKVKKSRDACYYACNFVAQTYVTEPLKISNNFVIKNEFEIDNLVEDVFNFGNIGNKNFSVLKNKNPLHQLGLFEEESIYSEDSVEYLGAILRKGIRTLDMDNTGYALSKLRCIDYPKIWNTLLVSSVYDCDNKLTREIVALKKADEYVNGTKPVEKRDEIYICKGVMLLMYCISKKYNNLVSNEIINLESLIEWNEVDCKDIRKCKLKDGIIPDYVYDVHTIKGKRAGKTDWEMNLVEFAGLNPLQEGFFDNGDWSNRYEYKWKNGMCTDKEYNAMLEYKKGRCCNPVEKIKDFCA